MEECQFFPNRALPCYVTLYFFGRYRNETTSFVKTTVMTRKGEKGSLSPNLSESEVVSGRVARPAAFKSGIPCSPPLPSPPSTHMRRGASINTSSTFCRHRHSLPCLTLPAPLIRPSIQSSDDSTNSHLISLARRCFSLIFVLARISFAGIAIRAAVLLPLQQEEQFAFGGQGQELTSRDNAIH